MKSFIISMALVFGLAGTANAGAMVAKASGPSSAGKIEVEFVYDPSDFDLTPGRLDQQERRGERFDGTVTIRNQAPERLSRYSGFGVTYYNATRIVWFDIAALVDRQWVSFFVRCTIPASLPTTELTCGDVFAWVDGAPKERWSMSVEPAECVVD